MHPRTALHLLATALLVIPARARAEESAKAPADTPTAPVAAAAPVLVLAFDESAAELPQDEMKLAIERELGRPVTLNPRPDLPELRISLTANGELSLHYREPTRDLERTLPRPGQSDQIPLLVSLAAGNLVRNQAEGLAQQRATSPPPAAPAPPRAALEPRRPGPRLHGPPHPPEPVYWLGVSFGLDYVSLPEATDICAGRVAYECQDGSGQTVVVDETGTPGSNSGGLARGSSRLLLGFDRRFGPHAELGARVGMSFHSLPDARTLHAEARASYVFGEARAGALRPYLFVGAGTAVVDAKLEVDIVERAPSVPPADSPRHRRVEAYALRGPWLVSGGGGLRYHPTSTVAVDLSLQCLALFGGWTSGFAVEPRLGVLVGF